MVCAMWGPNISLVQKTSKLTRANRSVAGACNSLRTGPPPFGHEEHNCILHSRLEIELSANTVGLAGRHPCVTWDPANRREALCCNSAGRGCQRHRWDSPHGPLQTPVYSHCGHQDAGAPGAVLCALPCAGCVAVRRLQRPEAGTCGPARPRGIAAGRTQAQAPRTGPSSPGSPCAATHDEVPACVRRQRPPARWQ